VHVCMCACVKIGSQAKVLVQACMLNTQKGVGKKIRVKKMASECSDPSRVSHTTTCSTCALHANTCPMTNARGHRVLNIICQSLVGQMGSKMNPRVRARPQSGHPLHALRSSYADSLSAHTRRKGQDVRSVHTAHMSNAWKQ
jgi:hypothetical protein